MNPQAPPKLPLRTPALTLLAAVLTTASASALPFLYAPGDLVLALRQTGAADDLVVNLGSITNYNALPPGVTVPVTQLDAGQLGRAFASLNGLRWSAGAANRPPLLPGYPLQTLWTVRPRVDVDVPATPWLRKGGPVQGNAGAQIDGVGYNAAQASGVLPGGPDNTATGVRVPINNYFAISPVLGPRGDYANNFQGLVENETPADFDADPANVSRSDLFELVPGTTAAGTLNAPGRHLGWFEFKPDGTLTFRTGSPDLAAPVITGITRAGEVTTVTFTTVAGATYQLRATDAAGLATPVSSWTTAATVAGDGGPRSLTETAAGAVRFYAVVAQP